MKKTQTSKLQKGVVSEISSNLQFNPWTESCIYQIYKKSHFKHEEEKCQIKTRTKNIFDVQPYWDSDQRDSRNLKEHYGQWCKLFRVIGMWFIYFCMLLSGKAYGTLKKCQIVEYPSLRALPSVDFVGLHLVSLDKPLAAVSALSNILFDLLVSNTFFT